MFCYARSFEKGSSDAPCIARCVRQVGVNIIRLPALLSLTTPPIWWCRLFRVLLTKTQQENEHTGARPLSPVCVNC